MLGGGILVVVLLVALIAILVTDLRDAGLLVAVSRFQGTNLTPLTESPDKASAERAAAARREQIQSLMLRYKVTEELEAEPSSIPTEFLESDPTLPSVLLPRDLTQLEASAQTARLVWQLSSDDWLLAERVCDAVVQYSRDSGPSSRMPTVWLRRDEGAAEHGKYHTRVVVESNDDALHRKLRESKWLGIGIDVAPPLPAAAYANHCQVGEGKAGLVGGLLALLRNSWGVTCDHVLSSECGSRLDRMNPPLGSVLKPVDAALIATGSGCFAIPNDSGASAMPVDAGTIDRLAGQSGDLEKRHPSSDRKRGQIQARVAAVDIGGRWYRFPHVYVTRRLWSVAGLIILPLGSRRFSKPGDSGTWVFERNSNNWIGMLIGGHQIFGFSVVALAGPLARFLMRSLPSSIRPSFGANPRWIGHY